MVTMENYEEYLLLHADGELGQAEEKALAAFIAQHPELRREMELYMATKTLPDMAMVYEGKEALLKKPTRVIRFGQWKMYAAAACIAILVTLGIWKWNTPNTTNINIVQVNNNNINITAPKDTFTGKQNTNENKVADVAPKQEVVKTPKPSLPAQQKVHNYVAAEHRQIRPAQETFASIEVPHARTLAARPISATPKILDASLPATEQATLGPAGQESSSLLARLPIKQEGITALTEAVNTKIEKVRNLRDNIKNTDLSVRLGNRELFVVKL